MIKKNYQYNGSAIWGVVLAGVIVLQMIFFYDMQVHTKIGGDGIFTYTLSNNPWEYLFINEPYSHFPKNNGWIDASLLRDNYVVTEDNRFNYSQVYFHQRTDVHPFLFYAAVHTICSLFPDEYSPMFAYSINLMSYLGIDILLILLCGKVFGSFRYAVVPIVYVTLMEIIHEQISFPRMYPMLAFFCLWYLYLHTHLLSERWKKSLLFQFSICIMLGSLTHYYFYVYAASVSVVMTVILLYKKKLHYFLNYELTGLGTVLLSWVIYPWALRHIFLNTQNKHSDINGWGGRKFYLLSRILIVWNLMKEDIYCF